MSFLCVTPVLRASVVQPKKRFREMLGIKQEALESPMAIEALEENKRLYEELLESEREKIVLLERMLGNK